MSEKKIPILDFDALIDAIEALSAPNALDVAISNTGMHVITENEVQGALTEVDTALYNINSSLTNLGSITYAPMSSGFTGSVAYSKIGRLVIISGVVNYTGALSANTAIASALPYGYTNNMPLVAVNNNTGTVINLLVKDNGELHTKTATESNGSIRFGGAYLSAN